MVPCLQETEEGSWGRGGLKMKKLNTLFGLIAALLLAASFATADNGFANGFTCCDWYVGEGCMGDCNDTGEYCTQIGFDHSLDKGICECIPEGFCHWVGDDTTCSGNCEDPGYVCNVTYDAQQNADYCVCDTTTTTTTLESTTTTTLPPTDCDKCCIQHDYAGGYCNYEACPSGTHEVDCDQYCETEMFCCCYEESSTTTVPSVPEFGSIGVLAIILITTPTLVYLLIRKRY
jgi:hypothetical protein